MTEHQRIIFNGNGYAKDWIVEAKRRGLPNITSTIDAAPTLTSEKAVALFEKFGIYTKPELESREEIIYETYAKTINIEALTMIDMAGKQILPAANKYVKNLADTAMQVRALGVDASAQITMLTAANEKLARAQKALDELITVEKQASEISNHKEKAYFYKDKVKVAMECLRIPCDELEMVVDKELWPIPTYAELMFEV